MEPACGPADIGGARAFGGVMVCSVLSAIRGF